MIKWTNHLLVVPKLTKQLSNSFQMNPQNRIPSSFGSRWLGYLSVQDRTRTVPRLAIFYMPRETHEHACMYVCMPASACRTHHLHSLASLPPVCLAIPCHGPGRLAGRQTCTTRNRQGWSGELHFLTTDTKQGSDTDLLRPAAVLVRWRGGRGGAPLTVPARRLKKRLASKSLPIDKSWEEEMGTLEEVTGFGQPTLA